VKFGLLLLARRSSDRTIEIAREVERLGLDAVWIPDERFFRDVYGTCAAIARATERVAVGPCVTDPYSRHPALTATAVATLDELSGGRAVLGIGAGASGFRELGIERAHPAIAVREAIELIRRLLAGEDVEARGRLVRFHGRLDFSPPRASLPIFVAAGGERLLDVAGALGDGVILQAQMTRTEISASVARVRTAAVSVGRTAGSVSIVARIDVAVDGSIEAAYDALRPRVARILTREWPEFRRFSRIGLDVPRDLRDLSANIPYTHDPAVLRPIAERVPNHFVDAFCVAATPRTLGERLAVVRDAAVDHLIVNPVPTRGEEIEPVIEAVASLLAA
jgi:5,10-methylenetetrahydromethanopterin reductase